MSSNHYIHLTNLDVALSFLVILIVIVMSYIFRLGIIKSFLLASFRTVVQLGILGLVLGYIFNFNSWISVALYGLFMTVVAGVTASRRPTVKIKGMGRVVIFSTFVASWSVTGFALLESIRPEPWYSPQYAIPLLGMVLGNMLNGISLGLERLLSGLKEGKAEIETMLTMGASRYEAALPFIKTSLRSGLMPITNAMSIAGLVSIPGMMTGQLMAGADPLGAVKYQIIVMFLIAGSCALGTLISCLSIYRIVFTVDHRFDFETYLKER